MGREGHSHHEPGEPPTWGHRLLRGHLREFRSRRRMYAGNGIVWDADNFNVPVQEHSLAWIALPTVGAVRFSGGPPGGETASSSHRQRRQEHPLASPAGAAWTPWVGGLQTGRGSSFGIVTAPPSSTGSTGRDEFEVYGDLRASALTPTAMLEGQIGTRLQIWDCNGGSNQQWIARRGRQLALGSVSLP